MKKQINQVTEISVSFRPAIASKPVIKSPLDAYVALKEFFSDDTIQVQEKFVVMYLNKANRVLGVYPVAIGGISSCVVDVRLILSVTLTTLCSSLILAHNHPSGSLKPSQPDIELSHKIKEEPSTWTFLYLITVSLPVSPANTSVLQTKGCYEPLCTWVRSQFLSIKTISHGKVTLGGDAMHDINYLAQ